MKVFHKTLKLDLDHDPSNGSLSKFNQVFLRSLYIILLELQSVKGAFSATICCVFAESGLVTKWVDQVVKKKNPKCSNDNLWSQCWNRSLSKSNQVFLRSLYIIPASLILIGSVVFARILSQIHRQTDRQTDTRQSKHYISRWWYNYCDI